LAGHNKGPAQRNQFRERDLPAAVENGWLHVAGDAAGYDRARAIFPNDVLAWVQTTQPEAWDVLSKNHGSKADDTLITRLRDQLEWSTLFGGQHYIKKGLNNALRR